MKNYFYIGLLLFSKVVVASTFEDEITLRSGNKAKIKPQSFRIDEENKNICFVNEGATVVTKISFKEFSSVEFGVNKFEVFKLNNSSSFEGFFVIAENKSYKLITRSVGSEEEGVQRYEFKVVDIYQNVVEEHVFDGKINQKSSSARAEIYGKIKFYFGENTRLIKRLEMYDRDAFSLENTTILSFFKNPVYFKIE